MLIERLFGPAAKLDRSTLERLFGELEWDLVVESEWLDYKGRAQPGRAGAGRDVRAWKESISKATVAFINGLTGTGGLVLVGIDEKDRLPLRFSPIPESEQTYEQLRSWLQADLQALPARFRSLDLEIVEVNVGAEGNVFLVEVHSADRIPLYYSVAWNQAFQRRADESVPLTLPESINVVRSRVAARVLLTLIPVPAAAGSSVIEILVGWVNEGVTPGRDLTAQIGCTAAAGLEAMTFSGTKTARVHQQLPSSFIMEVSAGMPPNSRPIYPGSNIEAGRIRFPSTVAGPLSFNTAVWESTGRSRQRFKWQGEPSPSGSIVEESRDYETYG